MDWISHLLIIWFLCLLFKVKKYRGVPIIAGVLPDVENISDVFGPSISSIIHHGPIHTLIGALFLSLLFAAFFERKEFKIVFILAFLAIVTHLILDSFIVLSGIMWLWPFSWQHYTLNLIWSNDIRPPIVFSILATIIYFINRNKKLNL